MKLVFTCFQIGDQRLVPVFAPAENQGDGEGEGESQDPQKDQKSPAQCLME